MLLDLQRGLDGIASVPDRIGMKENDHHAISGGFVYVAAIFLNNIKYFPVNTSAVKA
jgi:hypothetical protein